MSVSLSTSLGPIGSTRPRTRGSSAQEMKLDNALTHFIRGMVFGAFILLLGFIAGAVTSSLSQPPSDIIIPLAYDCTTDSECEGL